MIVVDVNLLIYAYNERSTAPARTWLEKILSGSEPVGLPWAVLHGFLRLVTSRHVMPTPLNISEAVAIVSAWIASPPVQVLEAGPEYWQVFQGLLLNANVQGPLVTDAHFAALAIENDATLRTVDGDFRRFVGLRVINPLV